ncbi:MAG: 2-oxoacid:acceptor oxidoreductase family protein, partial [Flavobacteriales bacterium]
MLELRGHARGGQGMVTAFEILAKIFSRGGYKVQAFPFFGVERTGAPIMAFFRASNSEILNRSNVYNPHLVVVFDETVIKQVPVFDGLRDKGAVLLNTERPASDFSGDANSVYTVSATQISLDKGLGSKSLPIVNAAMMGAVLKILGADIELAIQIIRENVPAKQEANAEAALLAYESVNGMDGENQYLKDALSGKIEYPSEEQTSIKSGNGLKKKKADVDTAPVWNKPMSLNKTGNWRVMTPQYVTRRPPCSGNCPAGTDVRLFVKQAAAGDFDAAKKTIFEHNPFPSVCGRVCPHFCQQNCNRIELDDALNIGAIERHIGDFGLADITEAPLSRKERIAIIGAGPAGLTSALRLRQNGYAVSIFEAKEKAGGMMRIGIPKFRLPDEALDREIEQIEKQGVEIILNKQVSIGELEDDYNAIVIATGAHKSSSMGVPGEEDATEGLAFLDDFKLRDERHNIREGDRVAVIGGGNTAVDVSRTALRLGAKATIYYRRTHKEMPAIAHEIEEAQHEGVALELLTAPVHVERKEDGLHVTMIKMKLGEPDESGRQRPEPVKGSETTIVVEHLITAIGQKNDGAAFGDKSPDVKQGQIPVEAKVPVFCSGDMAWGGTVTEAIGSGNEVAKEIHAFFSGMEYKPDDDESDIVLPKD